MNEARVEPARNVLARRRLLRDYVNNIDRPEIAAFAQKCLPPAVEPLLSQDRRSQSRLAAAHRRTRHLPTGEGARRLTHVLLRVVADAERVKFHKLTRVIFVRR